MKTSYLITIAAMVLGLTGAGCEYTKVLYPIDGKDLTETTKVEETTEMTETVVPILPSDPTSPSPDVVPPEPPPAGILPEEPPPSEIPPEELPPDGDPEDPPAVSGDTTPPTIVATLPPAGTGVNLVSAIGVVFSEPMDPATITAASMVVTTMTEGSSTVTVVGVNPINPWNFGFILSEQLAADTLYTVVVRNTVKDLADNRMTSSHGWSFRTIVDASPPEDPDANDDGAESGSHQINAGMLLWNGTRLNWEGVQAFELDALGVGLTSADTSISGEIRGSIVNRFKRNGPVAKPYDYRSYLTAVAYDSSTLKRVTRSYSRDHGCVASPNTDPPPMAINVSQEFGAAWASDTTGRYQYFAVLRSFEFDLFDSVGPEDVQVDVTLANDNHLPNAQGRLLPQITVDVNGPVDAFNCPFTVAFDVIGIDTTVWAARRFDTDGQPPAPGGGTYYFLRDVSFPFEIPGVDQTFVGLEGWGHNLEIEGNVFEIDSLGSWVSLVEVAENAARLKIAGHVQGYLSTLPDADRADAHASNRTRGYLFACKSEDICKAENRNLGGSYGDDIRYTRPVTVPVE